MRILKKQATSLAASFVLVSLLSFGCNKQEASPTPAQQPADTKNSNAGADPYVLERIPVQHRINPTDGSPLSLFRTDAHREHLNDPLVFSNLPNGPTAVVGSDLCLFYPAETDCKSKDKREYMSSLLF